MGHNFGLKISVSWINERFDAIGFKRNKTSNRTLETTMKKDGLRHITSNRDDRLPTGSYGWNMLKTLEQPCREKSALNGLRWFRTIKNTVEAQFDEF